MMMRHNNDGGEEEEDEFLNHCILLLFVVSIVFLFICKETLVFIPYVDPISQEVRTDVATVGDSYISSPFTRGRQKRSSFRSSEVVAMTAENMNSDVSKPRRASRRKRDINANDNFDFRYLLAPSPEGYQYQCPDGYEESDDGERNQYSDHETETETETESDLGPFEVGSRRKDMRRRRLNLVLELLREKARERERQQGLASLIHFVAQQPGEGLVTSPEIVDEEEEKIIYVPGSFEGMRGTFVFVPEGAGDISPPELEPYVLRDLGKHSSLRRLVDTFRG